MDITILLIFLTQIFQFHMNVHACNYRDAGGGMNPTRWWSSLIVQGLSTHEECEHHKHSSMSICMTINVQDRRKWSQHIFMIALGQNDSNWE